jgi:hypothetical protein
MEERRMSVELGYARALRAPMPPGRERPFLFLPGLGVLVSPHPRGHRLSVAEQAEAQAVAARLGADRPTGPAWITPGGAVTPAGRLDPAWLQHTTHHRLCWPLRFQAAP